MPYQRGHEMNRNHPDPAWMSRKWVLFRACRGAEEIFGTCQRTWPADTALPRGCRPGSETRSEGPLKGPSGPGTYRRQHSRGRPTDAHDHQEAAAQTGPSSTSAKSSSSAFRGRRADDPPDTAVGCRGRIEVRALEAICPSEIPSPRPQVRHRRISHQFLSGVCT